MEGIINHPQLQNLPFILETPNDLAGYAEEICVLSGLYKGNSLEIKRHL
jgi:deoxyribonuclease-4